MPSLRIVLVLMLALLLFGALPVPTQAQPRERCFAQTGYCVQGTFLDYWEQNGGLEVFGYPISPLRTETIEGTWTGPVQWFERDRLEDHGIDGVLAGRLGAYHLEQQGYDVWDAANRTDTAQEGCRYFPETGQNLCEPFLSYWEASDGLRRFGYPLTGVFEEQVGAWRGPVQYFERRRMEYHTDLPDAPPAILLGHLGQEVFSASEPRVCPVGVADSLRASFDRIRFQERLGCPGAVYTDVAAAMQPFEHGRMLWLDLGDEGRKVFAMSNMPALFQRVVDDPWTADLPPRPEQIAAPDLSTPPPGLLLPERGMGYAWAADIELPYRLGWATAPEQADRATVQRFANGWLVWMQAANAVYATGAQPTDLVFFAVPELFTAPDGQILLAGEPAPRLGGELVVRTQSIDFYRVPGGLTTAEIVALSGSVEQAIASGSTMMELNLSGRIALRFEPAQTGICAIRGLTLSGERTIRMFYNPGSNLRNIEAILAHEFIHQLQHDYYGVPYHLRSDNILLEGQATWASGPYFLNEDGEHSYHDDVRAAHQEGTLLPLTTDLFGDCRTTTRNTIYEQWASFTEYLLVTYGRDRFDQVYRTGNGRAAGSSDYAAVFGKSLAELEADWQAWVAAGR